MNNDISQLSQQVRGALIQPGDPPYGGARTVYNAMHDHRPALILQAADVADVRAGVNHARDQGMPLAIRGGGHSVPGYGTCDGGLVIDLGGMNSVHVDTSSSRVRAGGGCTLGDLDHATHAHGVAVPGGTVSTTGLAGLALGGGMGHLSRRCGLTCDRLRSAEVVTASGEIMSCDADNHPDLYWALRGGGGNFGVVTSFEFEAEPLESVYGGPTFFRIDPGVMRHYEGLIREMPHEFNAIFAMAKAPPAPFVPEDWHEQPVMAVLTCWSGDPGKDEHVLERVSSLGDVIGQALWRMPYPEINTFFDELLPHGLRHYWKANAATSLADDAIAMHIEHGARVPNLESGMFMMPINGACHEVGEAETAFANRNATFSAVISGTWHHARDDQANMAWVRDYHAALAPWSEPGGYVNFMSGDDQGIVEKNFGARLERLKKIKTRYDPENLFRINANIRPIG